MEVHEFTDTQETKVLIYEDVVCEFLAQSYSETIYTCLSFLRRGGEGTKEGGREGES